jgi:hypothetical protein
MSVVPPENKAPFKHDVIARYVLVRGVKYFIVAISCIGGGHWSPRRIAPTCRKSLTKFSLLSRIVIFFRCSTFHFVHSIE